MALLLLVGSAHAEELEISWQPSSVVLGRGENVTVLVRVPQADLVVRSATNAGSLMPAGETTGLERRYTWTAPPTQVPTVAVLLFWTEQRGQPPSVAAARVPLVGQTTLDIQTEPSALVRVQVGASTFGPHRADKRGVVHVPVEVPPGVQTAQVLAESQGRTTSRSAALGVPSTGTLLAAFSANPPVEGESCWMIVAHPDAFDPGQLRMELSGANATLESSAGSRAIYRVTPEQGARKIAVKLALANGDTAQLSTRISSADESLPTSPSSIPRRFSAAAEAGGFFAGGANAGAALAIDGSYALPAAAGRLSVDLELGYRTASLSSPVAGLGSVHSTLSAFSAELALRALAFQRGPWSVYGRIGGGVIPFTVSAHSDFQPPFSQTAVAAEAFASAQIGYWIRPVELFAELRGGIAPAHASTVDAQLGGVLFALGARYAIR